VTIPELGGQTTVDLTPKPGEDRLREAADALVRLRGPGYRFDPDDSRIADALESDDWCLECVGPDAAATVAAKVVAEILWPAASRASREDAARDIETFGNAARGRAQLYAPELSICARRANDAVVDAYVKAAALARVGDVRNVRCSKCGDTRGGQIGHETDECTWKPCNTANQPRTPAGRDGEGNPEERTDG
jgi:hypothetical protein